MNRSDCLARNFTAEAAESVLVSLSKRQHKKEKLKIAADVYRQAANLAHILFEGEETSFPGALNVDRSYGFSR